MRDVLDDEEYARRYARVREPFLLRTRLPVYRRRLERARAIIGEAVSRGRAYVGFSAGKDSMALIDLVREATPDVPAFHVDCDCETPATLEAMRRMRERGFAWEQVRTVYTLHEMCRIAGLYGYRGPEYQPGAYWGRGDVGHVLVREPVAQLRERGFEVALLGLRKRENRGRLISLRKYGPLHQRADGLWIAAPLADWDGEDVLAYCFERDLPLSEVYLDPDDEDRARRRTGPAIGSEGDTWGRFQDLRRRHPAFWAQLIREFPALTEMG